MFRRVWLLRLVARSFHSFNSQKRIYPLRQIRLLVSSIIPVVLSLVAFTCLVEVNGFAASTASDVTAEVSRIKKSLIQNYCYRIFWHGERIKQGIALPLELKLEGEKFYAWVEGAREAGWADLLSGERRGTITAITYLVGTKIDPASRDTYYLEYRSYFETGLVVESTLTIDINCGVLFGPPSPDKRLFKDSELKDLIRRVEKTDGEDIRLIWSDLGIASEMFDLEAELTGEVKQYSASGKVGKILLITITNSFKSDLQYLLFLHEKSAWRFLGNVDTSGQRYAQPTFRIERFGESGAWFVLHSLLGGGTGVVDYSDNWYDLTSNWRHSVLEYPEHGHMSGWGVPYGYEYQAKIVHHIIDKKYVVDITFGVDYFNADSNISDVSALFKKTLKARYVWEPSAKEFRFDRGVSTVLEDRLQRRGFTFADAATDFLRYYFTDLMRLARDPTPGLKVWLDRLLADCADNDQKRALLQSLNRNRRASGVSK